MDLPLAAQMLAIPSGFILGSYNAVFSQNVIPHLYNQPASVSTPIFAKVFNIGALTIAPMASTAIIAHAYLAYTQPMKRQYYTTAAVLTALSLPLTSVVMKPGINRLIEISKSNELLAKPGIDAEAVTFLKAWVTQNYFRGSLHLVAGFLGLPVLAPPPLWSLEDRVLTRFTARWATGNTCLGSYDVYRSTTSNDAVLSAVRAVAYADLAVVEGYDDFATKAVKSYLATLQSIQRLLNGSEGDLVGISSDLLAAVLALDTLEILYIRRPTPLGIHTGAVVRLLQIEMRKSSMHPKSTMLIRAAAPRIQARQLLCIDADLSDCIRSCAQISQDLTDVRVANFICDVCHELRFLKTAQVRQNAASICTRSVEDVIRRLQDLVFTEESYWAPITGDMAESRRDGTN
ncbi:hypothetical protein B0A48_11069 [Cryoendolithus antarcticus]|uniref:Uncharacterized protein n=1 Tax=Cryoendolithus antarcticus TaxID=1507870 RepID=A0A1V8SUC1_9PEZI|nr:hypothetical protein B0A48_11069 [Cryoendolithus antarcticus]